MEQELEASRASRSAYLAHFSEELRVKEEELQVKEEKSTTKEVGAYVNAHNNLLSKVKKRYPEEDLSWMDKLILEAEEDSNEEHEGEESERDVTRAQGGEDPPR